MGRRSVLVVAGWLGAAVLAVLVGLFAVNVIGAGLTSSSTRALTPADVDKQLQEAPAVPASASPPASSAAPSTAPPTSASPSAPAGETAAKQTRGGTVVARCSGNQAEILTMSPASGFTVHEKSPGLQREAEGEFRGSRDNHDRVKVRVTCAGGAPAISWSNDD
jgi:predicted short-subunit dehydrogenase-like oxidoreductase (DUF2520 family)